MHSLFELLLCLDFLVLTNARILALVSLVPCDCEWQIQSNYSCLLPLSIGASSSYSNPNSPITSTFGFVDEEDAPFVVFIAINSTSELVDENLLRLILVDCIIICGDCLSISTSHTSRRGTACPPMFAAIAEQSLLLPLDVIFVEGVLVVVVLLFAALSKGVTY